MGQTTTAEYVLFLQVMIFHQLQLMTLNAQEINQLHFFVKIGIATNQANVLVL